MLILLLILVGCDKKTDNKYNINIITEEEIFFQEPSEYYVYFYKEDCPYCDDVFNVVNDYLKSPTDIELYICKLDDESVIKRKIEDGTGQGPDGKYYVNGVTDYNNLYISGVPSLIKIINIEDKKESTYITSGRKNILQYFENLNSNKDLEK